MNQYEIGVVGLGVMGQNLALNLERNGFSVVGYDTDPQKQSASRDRFAGKSMAVAESLEDLVRELKTPRKVLIMVPAGKAVDEVINRLRPLMAPGDLMIDGGNSYFRDTERRYRDLGDAGLLFVGTGVSGGEEGALWGPSIMPGGAPEAWPLVRPLLEAIAAKAEDGTPCCRWIGTGGAGHFVKMVHNGIEYADMQMIAEAYFLMDRVLGMAPAEMAKVFDAWNRTELNSYLIQITARILERQDPETGRPLVDVILDTAGQKGTGKWTSQSALDLGVPAPTIAEAVFCRFTSAIKEVRVEASRRLSGPASLPPPPDRDEMTELIRQALLASKICSYAQGFELMRYASREYGFNLQYGDIAAIWRAGCIIRAQFLGRIKEAFDREGELTNLLFSPYFGDTVQRCQSAWRRVVCAAVERGIAVPAFSSALAYYDSYRSARLPANLLQAQRDYFGAHTYERVDRPRGEFFHTQWQEAES
ncbi:MAG: NADP-dependent phosphogluconate dehydrogenase [Acidobacteriota bacterium]